MQLPMKGNTKMKVFKNIYQTEINRFIYNDFNIADSVFFDIETTGFSASNTYLYMIGCLYYDSADATYKTIQWFLDDINDEKKLIETFFEFISEYKYLIHFNGNGFDIPYIKSKCEKLKINHKLDEIESIDLYKLAHSMKNILKLQNLKQKTIENFLNVSREDKYSGKELIDIYLKYLETKDNEAMALLVLHNLDDLKGMPSLLKLYDYKSIFEGDFSINSISIENKQIIMELLLHFTIPSRISAGNDLFYMTAFKDKLRIKTDIYTDELKYFYPNYKDYYYLPEEDKSIHKSVAFYVDKNFRTQAKAANCYSKKTGHFLPQRDVIVSPYFKIEYNDKITYFEVTDDFLGNPDEIHRYCKYILNELLS